MSSPARLYNQFYLVRPSHTSAVFLCVRYSLRQDKEERKMTSTETGYLYSGKEGDRQSNNQAERVRDQGASHLREGFAEAIREDLVRQGVLGNL